MYKPTIGADFHSKKLEIMQGEELKSVTLQVTTTDSHYAIDLTMLSWNLDMGYCRVGAISKLGRCLL